MRPLRFERAYLEVSEDLILKWLKLLSNLGWEFRILVVQIMAPFSRRPTVNSKYPVSSGFPQTERWSAVVKAETAVSPIACCRVRRCLAWDFALGNALRRTSYRQSYAQQSQKQNPTLHDEYIAQRDSLGKDDLRPTQVHAARRYAGFFRSGTRIRQ